MLNWRRNVPHVSQNEQLSAAFDGLIVARCRCLLTAVSNGYTRDAGSEV